MLSSQEQLPTVSDGWGYVIVLLSFYIFSRRRDCRFSFYIFSRRRDFTLFHSNTPRHPAAYRHYPGKFRPLYFVQFIVFLAFVFLLACLATYNYKHIYSVPSDPAANDIERKIHKGTSPVESKAGDHQGADASAAEDESLRARLLVEPPEEF